MVIMVCFCNENIYGQQQWCWIPWSHDLGSRNWERFYLCTISLLVVLISTYHYQRKLVFEKRRKFNVLSHLISEQILLHLLPYTNRTDVHAQIRCTYRILFVFLFSRFCKSLFVHWSFLLRIYLSRFVSEPDHNSCLMSPTCKSDLNSE